MKGLIKAKIVLLLAMAAPAAAGDLSYVWQPGFKKQVVQEACFKTNAKSGDVTACSSVPWIEDQRFGAGLTIGGSFAPGQRPEWMPLGLDYNLAPQARAGLLWLLQHASNTNQLGNLKMSLLPPTTSDALDVELNLGAKWGWRLGNGKAEGELLLSIGPRISWK